MVNEDMKEIDTSTNGQRDDKDFRAATLTGAMCNIGQHGRYGAKKTWLRLKQCGFQVAYDQVEERWRKSENCQAFRRRLTLDPLGHVQDTIAPGELVSVDFISPTIPQSQGHKYILAIVDH